MVNSYTQLSHYLACPRKYRYRYLDGWQEKETRAGMLFGRAFEQALGAYFHRQDATETLFKEWSAYQNTALDYSHGDNWDVCCSKGSSCWSFLPSRTASKSAIRNETCRSKSRGRCLRPVSS